MLSCRAQDCKYFCNALLDVLLFNFSVLSNLLLPRCALPVGSTGLSVITAPVLVCHNGVEVITAVGSIY